MNWLSICLTGLFVIIGKFNVVVSTGIDTNAPVMYFYLYIKLYFETLLYCYSEKIPHVYCYTNRYISNHVQNVQNQMMLYIFF